jgi:hypothetical protein
MGIPIKITFPADIYHTVKGSFLITRGKKDEFLLMLHNLSCRKPSISPEMMKTYSPPVQISRNFTAPIFTERLPLTNSNHA